MKTFKKLGALILAFAMTIMTVVGADLSTALAAKYNITAKTQAQLDAALADTSVSKIVLKGSNEITLMISSGTYSNKALVVNGTGITLINNAKFKSITIKKADEYTEIAKGNNITVAAKNASINLAKKSKVESLTLNKAGANIDLNVMGTAGKITVNKAANLNITGKKSNSVELVIKPGAESTKVTSDLKVTADKTIDINGLLSEKKEEVTDKKEEEKTEEKTEEKPEEKPVVKTTASDCAVTITKKDGTEANEYSLAVSLLDENGAVTSEHITSSDISAKVEKVEVKTPASLDAITKEINTTFYNKIVGNNGTEDKYYFTIGCAGVRISEEATVTVKVTVTDPTVSTAYPTGRKFEKTVEMKISPIPEEAAAGITCTIDKSTVDASDAYAKVTVKVLDKYSRVTNKHVSTAGVTATISNIIVSGTTDQAKINLVKSTINSSFKNVEVTKATDEDTFILPIEFSEMNTDSNVRVDFTITVVDSTITATYPSGRSFSKTVSLLITPPPSEDSIAAVKMSISDLTSTPIIYGGSTTLEVAFGDKNDKVLDRKTTSATVTIGGFSNAINNNANLRSAITKLITIKEEAKVGGVHVFKISVGALPDLTNLYSKDAATKTAEVDTITNGIKISIVVNGRDSTGKGFSKESFTVITLQ